MSLSPRPPAIVVLGNGSIDTARRIQASCIGAQIFGLAGRVDEADCHYDNFGAALREFYQSGTPIIALCAAGIVIRTLAPLLTEGEAAGKSAEPPVLAVAEDGSAVVPLLGGISGVNVMARDIAAALGTGAAITTSGELRFGTCLLDPPAGFVLSDIEKGKRFVSDLLAGQTVRIDGAAPWLADARLPLAPAATKTIRITAQADSAGGDELFIHPRSVLVAVAGELAHTVTATIVAQALRDAGVAIKSLAGLLAVACSMHSAALRATANELGVPLRFVSSVDATLPPHSRTIASQHSGLTIAIAEAPVDILSIGTKRGSLTVIGLGPGAIELMVPAARQALQNATDILGYETYIDMAGPFRAHQVLHRTDNREEMLRARHAFELAAAGRDVVMVSSGDPGVFAMATAVIEALHESADASWHAVELNIVPGVSAAMATAARAGAPLGHDFCLISLSDNLKPWNVIENRLDHAAAADFVLAFYNPISKARPWQLARALEIVATHRAADTVVVLGRDVGRPAESLRTTTLAQLTPDQVDMRTMVIIGSSTTRTFARADGGTWAYTPRWYPEAQKP